MIVMKSAGGVAAERLKVGSRRICGESDEVVERPSTDSERRG